MHHRGSSRQVSPEADIALNKNGATVPSATTYPSFTLSCADPAARDGLKEKLSGLKPAEITAKCIETLGQAGVLVDAKAPDDAAAFKGWLRQISQHVAEASKEGGFFGGVGPVSDKEKATLQDISSALKLAA